MKLYGKSFVTTISNIYSWNLIPDIIKKSRNLTGDELVIGLTKGFWSIISDEDFYLSDSRWSATFPGRSKNMVVAERRIRIGTSYQRQSIHGTIIKNAIHVDHADKHCLFEFGIVDNRRSNLRPVTVSENISNSRKRHGTSSSYKGVTWDKRRQLWSAQIMVNRKNIYLGRFNSETDAATRYNSAHKSHFPNIPEGLNTI